MFPQIAAPDYSSSCPPSMDTEYKDSLQLCINDSLGDGRGRTIPCSQNSSTLRETHLSFPCVSLRMLLAASNSKFSLNWLKK